MQKSLLGLALVAFVGFVWADEPDMDESYESLKKAVEAKDVDQILKLAVQTCDLARKVQKSEAPEDKDEKENWTKRVSYAKDVELYTEYALSAAVVEAKPEQVIKLAETLEAQNPKSKYLDGLYERYFLALQQTGAAAQIPKIADKAVVNFPNNVDLVYNVANTASATGQLDRAMAFADRLVAIMSTQSKPEGLSDADWARKRTIALGQGYYIAGMARAAKQLYFLANQNLRAALPFIKGDDYRTGAALFTLGLANYQLGKAQSNKGMVMEAIKFSEQAAQIKGPYQQQAYQNANAMRREVATMR